MQFAYLGNVEFQLAADSCSRSGWAGGRATLPDDLAVDPLVFVSEVIGRPVPPLLADLFRLIFANMVAAAEVRLRYQQGSQGASSSEGASASVQSSRTVKLTTAALRRLKALEEHYLKLRVVGELDELCVRKFLATLSEDRIVSALLDRCVRSYGGPSFRFWGYSGHDFQVFSLLDQAFADAKVFLQQSVKPGRSDPVYEQLVRALRGWYEEAIGKSPRRNYDGCKAKEVGPFLKFCRCVAEAVNRALPLDLRRVATRDMAKTVRRMIEEQDAEIEAFNTTKN